jgi:hypothetical protein
MVHAAPRAVATLRCSSPRFCSLEADLDAELLRVGSHGPPNDVGTPKLLVLHDGAKDGKVVRGKLDAVKRSALGGSRARI